MAQAVLRARLDHALVDVDGLLRGDIEELKEARDEASFLRLVERVLERGA